MEAYLIQPKVDGLTRGRRISFQLISLILFALVYFVIGSLLFHFNHPEQGWKSRAVTSIVWSFLMTFSQRLQFGKPYEIRVDENEIIAKVKWLGTNTRWVRRGRIRTILERPSGTILSERNKFATQIMGGVFLSHDLDKYDQLMNLATSWKKQTKT